ncbi:hypothetical protein CFIICLFH_2923 [Methylobacterium goesingense]|nr:hypothetical protein CFIICLFH_2923 [Methylobacterium goesingense]
MPMRIPSSPEFNRAACLTELSACIAEVEVSSSAQAATVRILARTGYDASEATQSLWGEMDALVALREVRSFLAIY